MTASSSRPLLVTGAAGMLGRTLLRRWPGALGSDRRTLDLRDTRAVDVAIATLRPRAVVHCAALTAVDRCESEVEAAFAANALASANLAGACARHGARLIAISTDYVFDGTLARPYHEYDQPAPRTVYGASKLAGEEAVRRHCPDHLIARVAWLYGPGGPSFIHTMLRLAAAPAARLAVVDDQRGNPTSTAAVADALLPLVDHPLVGTVHLSCEGETTWHGLARELFARRDLTPTLTPCTTVDFPRPAPRPANSRLDKLVLRQAGLPAMPDWRDALARFLADHPEG
jgi:dTDP-4-dehydrorhamnose reductase